jgi:hypothetical protein
MSLRGGVRCIYLYIVFSPYVRGFPAYLHLYLSLLLKRKTVAGVTLLVSDFTLRQDTKLPTNATTKLKNDSLSICVVLPQFVSLQHNFLGALIKEQLMIDLQERNSRPLSCSAPACTRVTPSVLFRTRFTASTGIG